VKDLGEKWLERSSGKRSLRHDKQRWGRIEEFFGPDRNIAAILTEDVIEFRDALGKEDTRRISDEAKAKDPKHRKLMAPATVNRHLALLRSALRYAEKSLRQRTLDPTSGVEMLDELNERDRLWTAKEYEQLREAAPPALRLAIIFAYWTGMRLGEITSLQWEQVDIKAGVARLKSKDTKTKEARIVPLPVAVLDALTEEARPVGGGALFKVRSSSLSPLFTRLARELEIENIRLHDARHTAATRLRRAGVDVLTIQRITGHKTLDMLRRYNTITEEDLVAAVAKATGL